MSACCVYIHNVILTVFFSILILLQVLNNVVATTAMFEYSHRYSNYLNILQGEVKRIEKCKTGEKKVFHINQHINTNVLETNTFLKCTC